MSRSQSPALPLAYLGLRVLILLNWLFGAAILALLIWSFTHEQWTFTALGVPPSPETRSLMTGMQTVAALGVAAVVLSYGMLKRLLAIIETVRSGEPFIAVNADRLHAIAWLLLGLQLIGTVIGGIGKAVSTPAHPLHLDAGFSPIGWLAVLLIFVLARIFAEGTLMREELAGTV